MSLSIYFELYNYLIAEWIAIFNPRTDPVSNLETDLVTAAVTIELIKHNEQVRGNNKIKKSVAFLINVWKMKE